MTSRRRATGPLAALASAILACGGGGADATPTGLESVAAERRDLVSTVAATGVVEPIRVIDVKSQASGEILEVGVEVGDIVERGALLVRIDPRDVRNAFEQAEADLDVARARLQIAERQLGRVEELHGSEVVTDEELESAVLEHANARAALVKAQTNLELAQDRLEDVVVRAPTTGTVVESNVEEGQIVTSTRDVTGGTTLVRMAALDEVQVRLLVDETDIGSIETGLPATIRVEAYPDREFRGTVLKIEPQAVVEQNVTMFAVLTRIRNDEGLLRPGMNADVEIVVGRRENVLALPNGAVKTPDEVRQLAGVLDLEVPDPLPPEGGGEARPPETIGDEGEGPDVDRIRSMSPAERREFFQNLSPAERQQMMARAQEAREAREEADRRNPARPKDAYVFVRQPESGALTLKPVRIGLSTWERTEVLAGLEEGDEVVTVPQSLIQQRELLDRIRSRSGVPGVQRQ